MKRQGVGTLQDGGTREGIGARWITRWFIGALIALVVAAGLTFWWMVRSVDDLSTRIAPFRPDRNLSEPRAAEAVEQAPTPERVAELVAAPSEPPDSQQDPAADLTSAAASRRIRSHVRGNACTPDASPLANVAIADSFGSHVALTDARGRFEADLDLAPGEWHELLVEDSGFATLRCGILRGGKREQETLIIAAPTIDLRGRVEDPDGRPVAGARIGIELADDWLHGFPFALDTTMAGPGLAVGTRSDELGRFAVSGAPTISRGRLFARADGYAQASIDLPTVALSEILLVLQPLASKPVDGGRPRIAGIVLAANGERVAQATVGYGQNRTSTDDDGQFSLGLPDQLPESTVLYAGKPGLGVTELREFGRLVAAARPYPPALLTLILPAQPLSIRGRVLDVEGRPLWGLNVALADGTQFPDQEIPPRTAEGFAADPDSESFASTPGAKTSADGSFKIDGLLDRTYIVQAWRDGGVLRLRSPPVPAGTQDLVLQIAPDHFLPPLDGVVVTRNGSAVENAAVNASVEIWRVVGWMTGYTSTSSIYTDAEGRFRLTKIPREGATIRASGDSIISTQVDVDATTPLPLRIVVASRCRFRLIVHGDPTSRQMRLLDSAGKDLRITTESDAGHSSGTTALALDAAVTVHSVSEDARSCVVIDRDSKELLRQPVLLVSERMNEIEIRLP